MGRLKQNAFTLLELVVVITILSVLGSISYLSISHYGKASRDVVRISDMGAIKTSLDLFYIDAGKYPLNTNTIDITYSGSIAWTQGLFGESTYKNVSILDKLPLDPLTSKNYIYSLTQDKQEYEIAGVMENSVSDQLSLFPNTDVHAGNKFGHLKINGNYNGKVLETSTGSKTYVLAVPSIVTSTGGTLQYIIENKLLAYDGYKNLPAQYNDSSYDVNGEENLQLVDIDNLEVFSGFSLDILGEESEQGDEARQIFLDNLIKAYSGTVLEKQGTLGEILGSNESKDNKILANSIVNNYFGFNLDTTSNETDFVDKWSVKFDSTLWNTLNLAGGNYLTWNSNEVEGTIGVSPDGLMANGGWTIGYHPKKIRITYVDSNPDLPLELNIGGTPVKFPDYKSGQEIEIPYLRNPETMEITSDFYGIFLSLPFDVTGEKTIKITNIEFSE